MYFKDTMVYIGAIYLRFVMIFVFPRPSSHGLELVSLISSILNKCTDRSGAAASSLSLGALAALWRGAALAPPGTWRALEPRLARDSRTQVQIR